MKLATLFNQLILNKSLKSFFKVLFLALLIAPLASKPAQAQDKSIYDDSFAADWTSYAWGVQPKLDATSYAHNGTRSIEVAYTGGWQGLGLHHLAFDTSPYKSLTFWINGGAVNNRTIQVAAIMNEATQPGVNINKYISGGSVTAGQWKQVTIPLTDLGVDKKSNVTGFAFQEYSGNAQPAFYLDDITLNEAPPPAVFSINVDTTKVVRKVDSRMFGLNVGNWDGMLKSSSTLSLVGSTPVKVLRYPGGRNADEFHWQTNRIDYGSGGWTVVTGFDEFANVAKNLGSQAYITVNYGSGTAKEAADWVAYANKTKGYGFKYWEIGNEVYGDWEYDTHAVPNDPYTYATEVKNYISAMKAVDPTIKIGVVAVPGEDSYVNNYNHSALNPRTGKVHYGWTPVMLSTLKSLGVTPDFIIHHRYDQEPGAENDENLLQSSRTWKNEAADLRQQLTDYLGSAGASVELTTTEHNSSTSIGNRQLTSLVNSLYIADTLGAALNTEFNSLMYWALRDGAGQVTCYNSSLYGWRKYGDLGIVSATNELYPSYYVLKLLKEFAAGGDSVLTTTTNYHLLSSYAVKRQDGSVSVLVVNKSPNTKYNTNISFNGYTPTGDFKVLSYGIPQDEAARKGVGSADFEQSYFSHASTSFYYGFSPYSVTLLRFTPKP